MPVPTATDGAWIDELVNFMRTQPVITAVRVDPSAQKLAVAPIGHVALDGLDDKLAETIAAVDAQLAAKAARRVPLGYTVRQEGGAVVVERDACVTAEKLWLWREMEWPELKAEPTPDEQEWRTLALLAFICGVAGIGGLLASIFLPGLPWLGRGLYLVALVAGGWDAAIDTWANLRQREVDIHFLMLAVAIGAMFIDAWGEAALLLFLFSSSG